jgi:3-isopropylmalate dehydrogenase
LRYSLDQGAAADAIEEAVVTVLDRGYRTEDILTADMHKVTTAQMGDAVVAALA